MVSIITLWSVVVFLDAIVISKVLKIMCMGVIIMILDKFGGMKLHVCCPFFTTYFVISIHFVTCWQWMHKFSSRSAQFKEFKSQRPIIIQVCPCDTCYDDREWNSSTAQFRNCHITLYTTLVRH